MIWPEYIVDNLNAYTIHVYYLNIWFDLNILANVTSEQQKKKK